MRSHLLSGSTLSVTDIAEEIGLELYYFSRMFPKWSVFPDRISQKCGRSGAAPYRQT
ncbi:hypothetical protein [Paenibacillus ginsengihumi]|uniref:hypothetical protein n=1 Tax=Paenibacillus ginsengihumi TaxID=431596 RepID=UPI0012ECB0D8|nr:hypothetical protein [Paenibacillus ginsengihumi]